MKINVINAINMSCLQLTIDLGGKKSLKSNKNECNTSPNQLNTGEH